jgi:spermidine synthase/uncharacterized membrane protein YoaT (DUF817 family)
MMSAAKGTRAFDLPIILFSLTLFLSAALMFAVQPMIGKMLLPLVGGTPSGWLVAMAFFQTALLIGYGLAAMAMRLPLIMHGAAVVALLLLGLTVLPVQLDAAQFATDRSHFISVIVGLSLAVLLPFVALATISTSLQRQFTHSGAASAQNPYFLYAASNLGSFAGLLTYPFFVEPALTLQEQTDLWRLVYLALITMCVLCLVVTALRSKGSAATSFAYTNTSIVPIGWRQRGQWLVLAFLPAALSLGLTSLITTDTGSVPFFWVIPLALYLLTFVWAFAGVNKLWGSIIAIVHLAAVASCLGRHVIGSSVGSLGMDFAGLILPVLAFFTAALLCHQRLADARPQNAQLGEYYFWLSLGGALGGIFGALIAPQLFILPIEFIVILLATLVFSPFFNSRFSIAKPPLLIVAGVLACTMTAIIVADLKDQQMLSTLARALLVIALVFLALAPRMLLGLGAVLIIVVAGFSLSRMQHVERNFFGVIRVFDVEKDGGTIRVLNHGTTLHGWQRIKPNLDLTPRTYYDPAGPLGDLFVTNPHQVGLIGLGAGSSLCYVAPGRNFTAYEIDADMAAAARQYFSYISGCGEPRMVIGDGRKKLEADSDVKYDLLVVDAFSSDAIPIHLLTREAIQLYRNRISPNGLIAFHISNRFYDLRPALAAAAKDLGLAALVRNYKPANDAYLATSSVWVVFAGRAEQIHGLRTKGWQDLSAPADHVWTDNYSDTISALRFN